MIDNIDELGTGHSLVLPGQKALLAHQVVCGCLRCHSMSPTEPPASRIKKDAAGRIISIMEELPSCHCCVYPGAYLIRLTSGAAAVNHAAFIASLTHR